MYHRCKSHGKCFGVCGSPASLAAFALAFAGTPASLPAFALAFAGSPASLAAFTLAFAGVPQVSRRLLWRLWESRKSRGVCLGVCGYSRKSRGVCLGVCGYSRKSHGKCFGVCGYSRKSRGKYFGVCGSPASLAGNTLVFAGVPQVLRRLPWRLRESRGVFPKTLWLPRGSRRDSRRALFLLSNLRVVLIAVDEQKA